MSLSEVLSSRNRIFHFRACEWLGQERCFAFLLLAVEFAIVFEPLHSITPSNDDSRFISWTKPTEDQIHSETGLVALIHLVSCMTWAYAFNFSRDSSQGEVPNPIPHSAGEQSRFACLKKSKFEFNSFLPFLADVDKTAPRNVWRNFCLWSFFPKWNSRVFRVFLMIRPPPRPFFLFLRYNLNRFARKEISF